MLTLKLQVNHNMANRYPNKPADEKYRLILLRGPAASSLYFYFTREELFSFADELVNLVSRIPTLENDQTITGLEATINPPANSDNNVIAISPHNLTAKPSKITAALPKPRRQT